MARLNRGVVQQSDLLRRAEDERHALDAQGKTNAAARESLLAQSEELKKKMAGAGGNGDGELRKQLLDTQGRLNRLESEGKFAETIVKSYGSSVCLLHGVKEFLDRSTGNSIRIAVDSLGKPLLHDKRMLQLDIAGNGPHLQRDVFGAGVLARNHGRILIDQHVAQPRKRKDEL